MIYSELYGAYYNTVAKILEEAVTHPVTDADIERMINENAFSESIWAIPDAIKEERWQLLTKDGTTPLENKPSMPVTLLQKRWLKSIACDPRVKLFGDIDFNYPGIEPLFLPEDYIVFDKYLDGDNYTDEKYISNFRRILDAVKNQYSLKIIAVNKDGNNKKHIVLPEYIEYSEKDDKFRVICFSEKRETTINIGRIVSCEPFNGNITFAKEKEKLVRPRTVVFELIDERNALERVLMHFAHFKKTAEKIDENKYLVTVYYDKDDEKEMIIRVLSFGPMIRVTGPKHFVKLIKERLYKQKEYEL